MPLYFTSLLFALIQFFNIGANQFATSDVTSSTNYSFSTDHTLSFHKTATTSTFCGHLGEEEAVDTEQEFGQVLLDAPVTGFFKKSLFSSNNKPFFFLKKNAFSGKTPLFVLHCNFRV